MQLNIPMRFPLTDFVFIWLRLINNDFHGCDCCDTSLPFCRIDCNLISLIIHCYLQNKSEKLFEVKKFFKMADNKFSNLKLPLFFNQNPLQSYMICAPISHLSFDQLHQVKWQIIQFCNFHVYKQATITRGYSNSFTLI